MLWCPARNHWMPVAPHLARIHRQLAPLTAGMGGCACSLLNRPTDRDLCTLYTLYTPACQTDTGLHTAYSVQSTAQTHTCTVTHCTPNTACHTDTDLYMQSAAIHITPSPPPPPPPPQKKKRRKKRCVFPLACSPASVINDKTLVSLGSPLPGGHVVVYVFLT